MHADPEMIEAAKAGGLQKLAERIHAGCDVNELGADFTEPFQLSRRRPARHDLTLSCRLH